LGGNEKTRLPARSCVAVDDAIQEIPKRAMAYMEAKRSAIDLALYNSFADQVRGKVQSPDRKNEDAIKIVDTRKRNFEDE